jgi:hypothetical protein
VTVACLHGQTRDDYQVYDAVIRHMFHDGVTRFDMNAKIDKIVIRDRTYSKYAHGPEKENWNQVKIRLRSLTDETIEAYEKARKDDRDLKIKLDIPFKYFLLSDKQLHAVFRDPNDYDKSMEYWYEFYKLYPTSGGYNSFSRVGYDKADRFALVYFVNWCGPLCGTGTYVLVENSETGWVVKETAGMWIS